MALARRHTGEGYSNQRHLCPMPPDRPAPWLIYANMAISPWPRSPGGWNEARRMMLEAVQRAIWTLDEPLRGAAWLDASSGELRRLPGEIAPSWLKNRVAQYQTFRLT